MSQLRWWTLLAGLPGAIMGATLIGTLYHGLVLSTEQSVERAARQAGETLDRLLFERYSDVETFASLPAVRNLDRGALQGVVDLFVSAYAPYYVHAVVVDRTGTVLAASPADRSGLTVRASDEPGSLAAAHTPWFQSAVATPGHAVVHYGSGELLGRTDGVPHDTVIVFSTAIKDGAGTVVGVWAAGLAVESLRHVLYKNGSPEGVPIPMMLKTPAGEKLLTIGEFNPGMPVTVIRSTGFSRWPGGQWTLETQVPAQLRLHQWRMLLVGLLFTAMVLIGGIALLTWIFQHRLIRPLEAIESQIGSIETRARLSDREPDAPIRHSIEADSPSHERLLRRNDELGAMARLLAEQTDVVRNHVRQLVELNESSRDIQEHVLSLPVLLQRILVTAKSLTRARYAALGVFDGNGTRLAHFITEGIDEDTKRAIGSLPTGRGLLGALHKQDVIRLKDIAQHPESVGFPAHHPVMRSFLGASLRAHGRLYGRLYLTDKLPPTPAEQAEQAADPLVGEFTDLDEQLIRTLAIQAGTAIETAGLIEELRTTQNRDRALLDSVEEGIYGIDRDGRCLFLNRAGSKMLGYDQHTLVGRDIHALIHQGREDGTPCHEAECPLRRIPESREGLRLEGEIFRRQDGTLFPVQGAATPLLDGSGAVMGMVVSFSDLTHRRLLESQVRQKQKLEALGELAGGVAHDFNNFLTVIYGHSQLALHRADLPASARAGIEEISKAADRARVLTSQLLMFSRNKPLARKAVDLREVIRGVESLIRHLVGSRIIVSLDLHDGPQTVVLDPGEFEQILMNLAVNARDAMPDGGRLDIRTASLDPAETADRFPAHRSFGASVMITVRDTGVGMDKATQARIFEPFFTTKAVGRGTGLGLATVARLVHDNGGAIQVASEPGVGTTFTLLFPLAESAAEPQDEPVVDQAIRGGDETILLVEHDRTVQSLTATMLRGAGYHVLTADDGHEGLRIANQEKGTIHALVSDVTMPQMNGPALAERLRRRRPGLKTLFMTVHGEGELAWHGLSSDQGDVLLKPFSRTSLLDAVRRVLDRPADPPILPHAAREPARVLIIDDDEQVNAMVQTMLRKEGYGVLAAPSGAQGLGLLRQEPVDLLLTDMLMPTMDGLDVIKEARRVRPSLKIIAMSGGGIGVTPDTYLDVAQSLGVSGILVKPFSCEALIKAVRQALEGRSPDP